MTHKVPEFENRDNEGTTNHYNGTVSTSVVAVPTSPGNPISEIIIQAGENTGKALYVSFDGGTYFWSLYSFASLGWTPKGNVTQVHLKGSATGVTYEMIINTEPA